MIAVILVLSLIAAGVALALPAYGDLILLAGPMAIASLFLLVRQWVARDPKSPVPSLLHLVIDGSNVLHWNENRPEIASVIAVVKRIRSEDFTVGVIFDANVGYKIGSRYLDDADLARLLDLPVDRVLVVPKGVQADGYILQAARGLQARIVTNDLYRDWAVDFPELSKPDFLITGGFRAGELWLDGI